MRILLVEDNPGDAHLIEFLFREAGEAEQIGAIHLVHADCLREALERVDAEEFDAVLLDLSLPDGQGRETFLRMQDCAPGLPIVALTGLDDESLAGELVASGAQDYLVKGQVDARLLARTLRYAVERKRAEEKLRLAAKVFEIALEGILVAGADQAIISVNRAFYGITGYAEEDVIGRQIFAQGAGEAGFFARIWSSQCGAEHWQGEALCRRRGGADLPVWLNVNAVKNAQGRITHHVAAFNDITDLKRSEERLRHIAHHDALTGLPNRVLFHDRLEQALAHSRRSKILTALLFIDLDRFKIINDTLGHRSGDELLKRAAERLRGCVREVDTVARLGGDEFAVILGDLSVREDAAVVARKVLHTLGRSFALEVQEVFVTASIGIAVFGDGEEESSLMEHADVAMYHAKRAGRNSFFFYSPQMNAHSQKRLALETDLRHALERAEFLLYYQPQVEPSSGRIVGVEALIRWNHSERGLIQPCEFISLLEETGLILPVGEWVMRTACRQARQWMDHGLGRLRMGVNLSARQLLQDDLAEQVAGVLAETGLPAELLEIELTESIVMENAAQATEALRKLKALGVRIALDDFGTGASSLSYLKHFPIDTLKISSAFIFEVEHEADAAIATAVFALARSMKLTSVAEGVETQKQLAFLRREQCDSIQGYLFSRPLPAHAMRNLIEAGDVRAVGV